MPAQCVLKLNTDAVWHTSAPGLTVQQAAQPGQGLCLRHGKTSRECISRRPEPCKAAPLVCNYIQFKTKVANSAPSLMCRTLRSAQFLREGIQRSKTAQGKPVGDIRGHHEASSDGHGAGTAPGLRRFGSGWRSSLRSSPFPEPNSASRAGGANPPTLQSSSRFPAQRLEAEWGVREWLEMPTSQSVRSASLRAQPPRAPTHTVDTRRSFGVHMDHTCLMGKVRNLAFTALRRATCTLAVQ